MKKDIRPELHQQLTQEVISSFVKYARFLIRLRFWRGQQGGDILPRGDSPESIVNSVVEKLLDGKINWDPQEVPLRYFLRQAIRREVGHLSTLLENRKGTTAEGLEYAVWPSNEFEGEQWVADFLEFLRSNGERDLVEVVRCMLDTDGKPRTIASRLGMSQIEIYNAKKRLSRRLNSFLETKRNEQNEVKP